MHSDKENPRVQVLMSTFNGTKYLPMQLESLQEQEDVDVSILIRDDGSTDGTLSYLQGYCQEHANTSFYTGENMKPARSFLNLISVSHDEEYFALCDQDDVWDSDKISVAITKMQGFPADVPVLYYSNLRIVDQDLNFIRNSHDRILVQKNKYSSLCEPLPTGCTMVFNKALRDLVKEKTPDYCSMHDSWIYMICQFFGVSIYDEIPHISYRQHGNNVIGAYTRKNLRFYVDKLKRMFDRNLQPRYHNAISFLECYGDKLIPEDYEKVWEVAHYKDSFSNRMKLLFDGDIVASTKERDLRNRILIICGLL